MPIPNVTQATNPNPTMSEEEQISFDTTTETEITVDDVATESPCVAGEDANITDTALGALASTVGTACDGTSGCATNITAIVCTETTRRRLRASGRELSASSPIKVVTKIFQTMFCQEIDCSTATEMAKAVAKAAEENLIDKVATGKFMDVLKAETEKAIETFMNNNPTAPRPVNAFAGSKVSVDSISFAEPNLEALETILEEIAKEAAAAAALNGNFYPAWGKGTDHMSIHTCYNDGEYPTWSAQYIKTTLEECCETYYRWAKKQCMLDGGAAISDVATEKWYVNWHTESCVQDCFESDKTATKNCGGLANNWNKLHDDASACCSTHLFWKADTCVATATNIVVNPTDLGTGKWYKKYNVNGRDGVSGA